MHNHYSNFHKSSQAPSSTPQWVLERIKNAKEGNLNSLYLSPVSSSGALEKIPDVVFGLSNLTSLDLSQNRLSTVPESITQMQNLTVLNLSQNQLSNFPESITQLQNLTSLDLSRNQLTKIPESITQLQNLIYLNLSENRLDTIPESITQLRNLVSLNLSGNRLGTIPETITQLQNLISLGFSRNQLSTVPESITRMQKLTSLNLSENQLRTVPESITRMQKLTSLNLSENQLRTVPESITRMQNLYSVDFKGNPLITPPVEIAARGISAIIQYFEQLSRQGQDYLYEAKLLILGEGGAGKTTLANKIKDPAYILKEEKSTKGVDVIQWTFPIQGERQFRVNIWDFGGQEIYHATHQFFLTHRSLYALVADTRQEDTDFYYWLNIAELLGDGSPLLIVNNEKQDRHREINERLLRGQFDCLKEVLATNLADNRGLQKVRQEVEHYIQNLPHIGTPLPRNWVKVREQLEKDPRNYISQEEYISICKANGFAEIRDIMQLSGYLNDIGVFLHFQDDPLLKKTVILKPRWGTDAVYKVLDDRAVIKNLGRFTRTELKKIWNDPEYETMQDELLQLMMNFKLCYEIPTQKGSYIAPQLLTENQPEHYWNADAQNTLLLRYSYEFMPKGILTQFIVVMHPYIYEHNKVWKSGVIIEKDNTLAEIIEYYGKREIHVRVAGPQARELMTIIRFELKQIHDTYKRLKYDELIRCNCSTCKDSLESHLYAVSTLLKFKGDNQLQIQCQKSYNMVSVLGLLGDLIDLHKLSEEDAHANIIVQGNYYEGDNKMTENKINIKGSMIHGSVVAAKTIQDSFNVINNSNARDELKEQLNLLAQAVNTMAKELPQEKAEEVADDMKRLAEEAIKEKPNSKWYSISIGGLVAAAKNIGTVGIPVIELATKVGKLLSVG
jgi:internalin A